MDSLFSELFGVDSSAALEFFLSGLREVTDREPGEQMFYVASVLAHYSQTSRYDRIVMPSLADLAEVFDNFVLLQTDDPEILELGGSQIILFAGFFRDQMRRRHNLVWYDGLGQSFYDRAGYHSKEIKKKRLFGRMAESLPNWTLACRDLSRVCRDNRLLLKI